MVQIVHTIDLMVEQEQKTKIQNQMRVDAQKKNTFIPISSQCIDVGRSESRCRARGNSRIEYFISTWVNTTVCEKNQEHHLNYHKILKKKP